MDEKSMAHILHSDPTWIRERVKAHGQVTDGIKLDLKQLEQRASLEKLTLSSLEKLTLSSNGCKVLSLSGNSS